MPFGIQLPGPFTWHAQDKSSKKLLRQQRKQNSQSITELSEQLTRENQDQWIVAFYGFEAAASRLSEINDLQRVSPALAEQKRQELLRGIDKASVLEPMAHASKTKREYRKAFKAQFGTSPTMRDIFAFRAAWKAVKREREG